jgi:arylmalonate decarboxylase
MSSEPLVGLIVPARAGAVPADGPQLYPTGVRFLASGLGLERLTPEGYDGVIGRAGELARALATEGAEAVALMGTSLSFYRGYAFNEQLKATMHEASGLPVTTMSTGVVEGLRAVGARRLAVVTAYIEEVNNRLRQFLTNSGFAVLELQGLGIDVVGEARNVPPEALIELGQRSFAAAPGADGILISCGGLRTLNVTVPLEHACGVPVISSTPAAFWSAVRLVGLSGAAPGYGRLFELETSTPSVATAS